MNVTYDIKPPEFLRDLTDQEAQDRLVEVMKDPDFRKAEIYRYGVPDKARTPGKFDRPWGRDEEQ